jgi:hypothetical protein
MTNAWAQNIALTPGASYCVFAQDVATGAVFQDSITLPGPVPGNLGAPASFLLTPDETVNRNPAIVALLSPASMNSEYRYAVVENASRTTCPVLTPAQVALLPITATLTNPSTGLQWRQILVSTDGTVENLARGMTYCVYAQEESSGTVFQDWVTLP